MSDNNSGCLVVNEPTKKPCEKSDDPQWLPPGEFQFRPNL